MQTTPPSDPSTGDGTKHWRSWQAAGCDCRVFDPPEPNEHGFTLIYLHDWNNHEAQGVEEDATNNELGEVTLVGRAPFEAAFIKHGLRVIAPQCGPCWWSDRPTAEFQHAGPNGLETAQHFVRHSLLSAIEAEFNVAPPQLGLFGIGMGGQGAMRISYRHPNTFPVVAGIAADLDFHARVKEGNEVLFEIYGGTESARQDTAILHIHPLNWPRHQFFCADPNEFRTFESADRLRMKMASIGIMFECDLETQTPGNVDYADHMADTVVSFLVERLNKERLRVV